MVSKFIHRARWWATHRETKLLSRLQLLLIAQPPSQTKVENYKCEAAVRLGICQIALGILAIGLNVNTDLSHPTLSPSKRIISYLQMSVFIEMIRI